MQKKILIGLFTLLFIAVVWVLSALLGDDPQVNIAYENLSPTQTQQTKSVEKMTWTQDLADPMSTKFSFPVNELFIQIDLKEYVAPKTRFFQLLIDKADRYSIFCIVQTLSSMNFPYVVSKEGKDTVIHVSAKDKALMEEVAQKLKHFDIDSKIIEVWL